MKLEVVNPFDAEELCSATVVRVLEHLVQVHVDAPLHAPSTPIASHLASRCPFTDLDPPEPRLVVDGAPIESALESFGSAGDEEREWPMGLSLFLPWNSSELFPVGWARHFGHRFAPPLQLTPVASDEQSLEPATTSVATSESDERGANAPSGTGELVAPPAEKTVAPTGGTGAETETAPPKSPEKQLLDKTLDMSAANASSTGFLPPTLPQQMECWR